MAAVSGEEEEEKQEGFVGRVDRARGVKLARDDHGELEPGVMDELARRCLAVFLE